MTENMRRFMEVISADIELRERATKAETQEELTRLAGEVGVALGEEDFAEQTQDSELSEEDLESVVGGVSCCMCILSGSGEEDGESGENDAEEPCKCVLFGTGEAEMDCVCYVAGQGKNE